MGNSMAEPSTEKKTEYDYTSEVNAETKRESVVIQPSESGSADGETEKMTVYHYTSEENAEAIRESGVIQTSTRGIAGGDKVYVTSMTPSEGKAAIARNNYDGMTGAYWEQKESEGYVDTCFKLSVPENRLTKVDDSRDIYTHDGPVELADYQP